MSDRALLEMWKRRAMELDKTLCWLRIEIPRGRPRNELMAMADETDDELSAFLQSIDDAEKSPLR